ncbi:MAG: aldehyde ferredoxin oxidoreductase family protein [Tissierellaceae bacterium]|nr:aldehyde ferredoxin oxidoreductase family protein [Tissierellaceae bacterium]
MLKGYAGKLLFVNLSTGEIKREDLSEELARNFIGGYGIGAKILYEMMPKGADPLGPESVLGFLTGPASATKALFGGRYTMVHKSPVTGGWNDSNSGGYFGPELKRAGYDGLFIWGIAEKPVYLYINDENVEIRDASHLWGMDTTKVWDALKKETEEPKLRVTAIGKSGENMALLSCPINDGHRAPGRGGGGAVMGSKKLKAIAVRGTREIQVANPKRLAEINRNIREKMKNSPSADSFGTYGTGGGTAASALSGDSPVKNWAGVGITDYGEENAHKVSSQSMDRYKTRKYACSYCPLGCGAVYSVDDGRWPIEETDRPEYETASAFGSTLLCNEEDAIIKCNDICNLYGIDTISTGMTIAWAMECYNKGILSKDELDGIDLTWGNGDAIVELTQKIADGEGCGKVLSNGSAYAAKKWGKGEEYLVTASGIELPMHDPRFAPGLARTYQYDPTPGRHVKGGVGSLQMGGSEPVDKYIYEDTGELDVKLTSTREIVNVASLCIFGRVGMSSTTQNEFIEAITGMEFGPEESFKTGLRIFTMRHAFNLREGFKPSDFTLSNRSVGKPPLESGPLAEVTVDNELLARNFFDSMGWDFETGNPKLGVLKDLGHLEDVIEDLYG